MIEIKNGRIVMPDEITENKSILIENGIIKDICTFSGKADRTINAYGRYILPGFIDIHSDKIEKFIRPCPTAVFDYEFALSEKDKSVILEYAERFGLFLTGGSDFHGRYEPDSPDIGDYISEESGVEHILQF